MSDGYMISVNDFRREPMRSLSGSGKLSEVAGHLSSSDPADCLEP